jgi:hypothetical protein
MTFSTTGILRFLVCSFCLIFLNIKPVGAQKNALIQELLQEFFIGETVYAQQKEEIQITFCPAFWKSNSLQTINIPLQFEYGLTDRLQFETRIPYNFYSPTSSLRNNGIGGAEIGFLYNVINNSKPFGLSLSLGCVLPIQQNTKGFEETAAEWEHQ